MRQHSSRPYGSQSGSTTASTDDSPSSDRHTSESKHSSQPNNIKITVTHVLSSESHLSTSKRRRYDQSDSDDYVEIAIPWSSRGIQKQSPSQSEASSIGNVVPLESLAQESSQVLQRECAETLPILRKARIIGDSLEAGPVVVIGPQASMVAKALDDPTVTAEVTITLQGSESLASLDGIARCIDTQISAFILRQISADGKDPPLPHELPASVKDNLVEELTLLHDIILIERYASAKLLRCESTAALCCDEIRRRMGAPQASMTKSEDLSILLPLAAIAASIYEDRSLLVSCYWLLRHTFCTSEFPRSWVICTDETAPAVTYANVGVLHYGIDTAEEESLASVLGVSVSNNQNSSGDPSTNLPVVFGAGCLRVGHLSIPLSAFRSVANADKVCKMNLLIPPQGYVLCNLRRYRAPSLGLGSGPYPQVYVLLSDHDAVPLLAAYKESEHGSAYIYKYPQFCGFTTDEEGSLAARWADGGGADKWHPSKLMIASKFGPLCVGKVQENYWGNKFKVFNAGLPEKLTTDKRCSQLPFHKQQRLATIRYDLNIMGDVPRRIYLDWGEPADATEATKSSRLENLIPRWDAMLQSYALPFYDRVRKPSAKNFQLVEQRKPNDILFMFGKCSKDMFSLDFRTPITETVALGLAISALAKKRVVA